MADALKNMGKIEDPKWVNKRLRQFREAAEGTGRKAREAEQRLRLLKSCKDRCCGKKLEKLCKRCPRRQAEAVFTPLKIQLDNTALKSA